MQFPTLEFLLFFSGILLVLYLIKKNNLLIKLWLLLASFAFYASFDIRFVGILVYSIVYNYLLIELSRSVEKNFRKYVLVSGIILNILTLVLFKYYDFFRINLSSSFGTDLSVLSILIPVGISFFTFKNISVLIDHYKDEIKQDFNFIDYSLFVSFFPQILAGPLMRFGDFLEQLNNISFEFERENLQKNLGRFLLGVFKKIVVVSYLNEALVGGVFQIPSQYSFVDLWLGMYAYAIVIYMDFSGYSDMAISISRLIGFKSPENFNKPYFAKDIQDFWRRWHMSLSNWVRDYFYIPLGGNRKGIIMQSFNIVFTMTLIGLWHGVGETFIIWGFLHGILLLITILLKKIGILGYVPKIFRIIINFHIIAFLWILFNSENMQVVLDYLNGMFNFESISLSIDLNIIFLIISSLIIQFNEVKIISWYSKTIGSLRIPFQALVWGILLLVILLFGPDTVPDFIYYRF